MAQWSDRCQVHATGGEFNLLVLGATLIGYVTMNVGALLIAVALAADPQRALWLLVYLPASLVVEFFVMRPVRLIAILQELLLRSSYRETMPTV